MSGRSPAPGRPDPADSRPQQEVTADDVLDILDRADQFYRQQLTTSWVPGYLAGRGFPRSVQQDWQIGYAPAGRDALTRLLRSRGYPDSVIVAAGLARESRPGVITDTFRDRLMIPIREASGLIIAFIGRAAEHARPDVPKYLNSPRTVLYDKSTVLFGLSESRRALAAGATPLIVEGPLDVIAVAMAGQDRYAPVAPCGTALTPRQVTALHRAARLAKRGVLVAFDADNAGRRAAISAYPMLARRTAKIEAVAFATGHDPSAGPAGGWPGRARRCAREPAASARRLRGRRRTRQMDALDVVRRRPDRRATGGRARDRRHAAARGRAAGWPGRHLART